MGGFLRIQELFNSLPSCEYVHNLVYIHYISSDGPSPRAYINMLWAYINILYSQLGKGTLGWKQRERGILEGKKKEGAGFFRLKKKSWGPTWIRQDFTPTESKKGNLGKWGRADQATQEIEAETFFENNKFTTQCNEGGAIRRVNIHIYRPYTTYLHIFIYTYIDICI